MESRHWLLGWCIRFGSVGCPLLVESHTVHVCIDVGEPVPLAHGELEGDIIDLVGYGVGSFPVRSEFVALVRLRRRYVEHH